MHQHRSQLEADDSAMFARGLFQQRDGISTEWP
jgi:hypothetical protein